MRCGADKAIEHGCCASKIDTDGSRRFAQQGGSSPTETVGRVLARGRRPCLYAERHRSRDAVPPSQHTLPISSALWTRIGVRNDNVADRGFTVRAARVKGNPPSFAANQPIRIGTTRYDSMEPQFLSPSAGWRPHTRHPARLGRLPGVLWLTVRGHDTQ
jgi:hypothetical protein